MKKSLKIKLRFWLNKIQNKLFFKQRLRKATPVLIYQMGKVASSSISKSLKSQYPGIVQHTHTFSENDQKWQVRHLHNWAVREQQPINIISLVREPIGRNVSAFFQTFEKRISISFKDCNFSIEEFQETFLSKYRHDIPLYWFERNIDNNFNIDVYATPFPECGFCTYTKDNIRLLVMRCELDDD